MISWKYIAPPDYHRAIPRARRVRVTIAMARASLLSVHRELDGCSACPKMIGPPIHGGPVVSRVMLVGQAPGPREGLLGRPFGWTAGKRLFHWFEDAMGVDEETFRKRVYIAAVARCFPGKSKGGGDRRPDVKETARCRPFLEQEVAILRPELVLAVGQLAIGEIIPEAKEL